MKNFQGARWVRWLFLALVLVTFLVGCGSSSDDDDDDDPDPISEADIRGDSGVLGLADSTVFRVTVDSVDGRPEASTFNLLGGENETSPAPFGNQLENYVVAPRDSIDLAIYDASGEEIGRVSIASDAQIGSASAGLKSVNMATNAVSEPQTAQPVPNGRLAEGVIEDVQRDGTFTDVRIPLVCGGGTTDPFDPEPNDGFFIINDVAIEFNYAFDEPESFNSVFRVKLIESDRNFDNMDLYFRLPNRPANEVIDAQTGQVVPEEDLSDIFTRVTQTVNSSTPFETAFAIVDLEQVPFGPSQRVRTTVKEVEGACTQGAQSFYIKDEPRALDPAAITAIGQEFDWPTQEDSLILLILGDMAGDMATNLDFNPPGITEGDTGVPYDFTFTATNIPSGIDEVTFDWTFGTGTPGSTGTATEPVTNGRAETSATYTYNLEGAWSVVVSVSDPDGETLVTDSVGVNIGAVTPRPDTDMEQCGIDYRKDGEQGITTDRFIISSDVPEGARVDFYHNARNIPDRFTVDYDGRRVLDTGWVGAERFVDRDPELYPGGYGGPTGLTVEDIFRVGSTREFVVTVNGPDSNTLWDYRVTCVIE